MKLFVEASKRLFGLIVWPWHGGVFESDHDTLPWPGWSARNLLRRGRFVKVSRRCGKTLNYIIF